MERENDMQEKPVFRLHNHPEALEQVTFGSLKHYVAPERIKGIFPRYNCSYGNAESLNRLAEEAYLNGMDKSKAVFWKKIQVKFISS